MNSPPCRTANAADPEITAPVVSMMAFMTFQSSLNHKRMCANAHCISSHFLDATSWSQRSVSSSIACLFSVVDSSTDNSHSRLFARYVRKWFRIVELILAIFGSIITLVTFYFLLIYL